MRERIVDVVLLTLIVDAAASVAVWLLERRAHGSAITNVGDAVFWVSAQLLTVSSQLPNPITTGARVVDIALELYAIIVVTTMAGMFASFFHHRERERRNAADNAGAAPSR